MSYELEKTQRPYDTLPDVTDANAFPSADADAVPSVTAEQMREVDRAMVQEYGIQLTQMMENAGRSLGHLARTRFLDGEPRGKRALVLAGRGGNGGGGMVCARRLHTWGAEVHVLTASPISEIEGVPDDQLGILRRMGVTVSHGPDSPDLPEADIVIDAIIGNSLRGAPSGAAASLIRAANAHGAPVLSLDVPSGVDASTGSVTEPSIRATATLTLALPKTGLYTAAAAQYVGELYLADISVPPQLYDASLGLTVGPIFAKGDIFRLR